NRLSRWRRLRGLADDEGDVPTRPAPVLPAECRAPARRPDERRGPGLAGLAGSGELRAWPADLVPGRLARAARFRAIRPAAERGIPVAPGAAGMGHRVLEGDRAPRPGAVAPRPRRADAQRRSGLLDGRVDRRPAGGQGKTG